MIDRAGSSTFDLYANDYEATLQRGLSLSGEDSFYFARERVAWLGRRLQELGGSGATILDYGCGTGSTTQYLLGLPGARRLVGADSSLESLKVARREHGSVHATFVPISEPPAEGSVDIAYSNGVFHHLRPDERPAALRWIARALRPGGLFALFENNPWNPGTRLVMSRIPFDRDAKTLSPIEARRMLRAADFNVVASDSLFFFPRALRLLRPLERRLARAPLGGQYLALARSPGHAPPSRGIAKECLSAGGLASQDPELGPAKRERA